MEFPKINTEEIKKNLNKSFGIKDDSEESAELEFENRTEHAESLSDYSEEELSYLKKVMSSLEYNAKVVGADFDMAVKLGLPFQGSFFDSEEISITFDPEHILKDEKEATFVAGHEGAHRAITPHPGDLGFTKSKIEKLYSQIGFGYLHNVVEDAVVNDWLQKKFVGFQSLVAYNYDKTFEKDNIPMGTGETNMMAAKLGYSPLFTYYGAELLRYWHTKRISEEMDPFLEEAVKESLGTANISIKQRPSSNPSKSQILATARKRFSINTKNLYPIMERLVEKDKEKMAERNAMEDYMKQKQELDNKKQELDKAQKNGDQKKEKQLEKEIEDMEEKLKKMGDLSEEALKELEKKIREAMKKLKEEMEKGEKGEGGEGGDSMPIPMDQLSDELKQEIKDFFDNLPKSEKKKHKKNAEQQLKEIEDALNKDLEGQLQENKDENSHENQDKRQKEKNKDQKKQDELKKNIESKERERRNELSNYERAAEDVYDVIGELRNSFIRFFEPNKHPRWQSGFDSGQRPNMDYAMQSQIDPRYYHKMWERKTIPHKMSYNITLLLDLSGSMSGENLEESFKAIVAIAESLSRFSMIDCEVIGYHYHHFQKVYKKGKERLNDNNREELGSIMTEEFGSTATTEGTEYALKRIRQNSKQENILITLTDGVPDSSYSLVDLMQKEIPKGDVKFVGVGLGSGIAEETLKEFYPKVLHKASVKLSERQIKQGENTFAEDLVELLKELIMQRKY